MRKTCAGRIKINLLKDVVFRLQFGEKVIKLVDIRAPNLWGHFKNGVLKACVEVCGKKSGRSKGDTRGWNEEVMEAVSGMKEAYKAMCQYCTEENKRRLKAMREKVEEALTELQNCPYGMFRIVKGLKTDSKDVEGGSDGKLCFSEKERGKVWKDYIERRMNEENDWDHNVEGDAVEGPVVCVSRKEVLQALNEMKTGKAPDPSEV